MHNADRRARAALDSSGEFAWGVAARQDFPAAFSLHSMQGPGEGHAPPRDMQPHTANLQVCAAKYHSLSFPLPMKATLDIKAPFRTFTCVAGVAHTELPRAHGHVQGAWHIHFVAKTVRQPTSRSACGIWGACPPLAPACSAGRLGTSPIRPSHAMGRV